MSTLWCTTLQVRPGRFCKEKTDGLFWLVLFGSDVEKFLEVA